MFNHYTVQEVQSILPFALLEISQYQRHPLVYWKNSNVAQLSLMKNKIVQYYL